MFSCRDLTIGVLAALPLAAPSAARPQAGVTTLVSVDSAGNQGDFESSYPAISADGRCIAFFSLADNLVAGDANDRYDVFVRDLESHQTTRVSVSSSGVEGNGISLEPSISSDGRYVAFWSRAFNLVPGDTSLSADVFVHDRATAQTSRVSLSSLGGQGDGDSLDSSISADGRLVAFYSLATNLVPGDTNGRPDVFVHDRLTGQTARVSLNSAGSEAALDSLEPALSGDGRYVAFWSYASNLVPGDTNGAVDVFVHDRATGQTTRVSVDSNGNQGLSASGMPSISSDGRFVAFESTASNLVSGDTNGGSDVFLHDRLTGGTRRVSVASGGAQVLAGSSRPSVSGDGRCVAFMSVASDLVPGDTNFLSDVFVHDRTTTQTIRVSVSSLGAGGNDPSNDASISYDGRLVTYWSYASNLVPGDTNFAPDVFLHDAFDCSSVSYCTAKVSSNFCVPQVESSGAPNVSAPAGFAIFTSHMESQRNALTFFGTTGAASFPFQGGFLCVQPPLFRLEVQNSGGSGTCQGSIGYTLADVLAHASGGGFVTAGSLVYCETWCRDPGDPTGSSLSNALRFQVCP